MRTIVSRQFTVDKSYVEIFGTSSESKPTAGIVTGSRYTEVNTGDVYLFSETTSEWVKQPAHGGGSGGGVLVVTDTDGTLDKTWQEIYDAAENKIPTALRFIEENNILFNWLSSVFKEGEDSFYVDFGTEGVNFEEFTSDSASGYPSTGS